MHEPLTHRDVRLNTGDEYRQGGHASRFDAPDELLQIPEPLYHVLAHAEHGDKWLALAISPASSSPLHVGIRVGEHLATYRIPAAHRRDDADRCNGNALGKGVAHDQLDHLGNVPGVRLIPVEIDAEPSAKTRELLGDERQHLRGDLHELGVGVKRVLVTTARDQAHEKLHGLRCFALLFLEAVLANFGQLHDFRHALVGEHRCCLGIRQLRRDPVGLRSHVDQAHEDDVGGLKVRGQLRIVLIDVGVVVALQPNGDACLGESPLDVGPDPGVEPLDTDDKGNRSHAPPRLTPQTVLLC